MSADPHPILPTDALLETLVAATASVTGQDFFDALTRALGTTLHASHVSLSQPAPTDPNSVETLSLFADGRHHPNFTYALEHTPCKDVLGHAYAHYPDDITTLFPHDKFFVDTHARSYIGVPLATPDQHALGLLTLCHDHPTHHLAHLKDVLTLFATRAAAEVTRLRAERALRDAHATLDRRVHERTAEFSAVTSRIPCILWRGTVTPPAGWRDNPSLLFDMGIWEYSIIDTDAAQRLLPLDVPPGEQYGQAWERSLHPDDRAVIFGSLAEALTMDLRAFSRDYRCTDRDGHLHWCHEELVIEPDARGRFRLFGVVTDATPRKLAELALRESERRYDLAARSGHVGIWEWDLVTDDIYLSDNLKHLLGYPPNFPLEHGPTWHAHLHPDDIQKVLDATDAHLNRGAPYEIEVRRRHREGHYCWFLSRGSSTRDPATGRPLRMTGSLTDITDGKRAEEALRQSQRRYALATDAGHVGVWEYDYVADSLYISPQLSALHGLADGQIADIAAWRARTHPDDRPRVTAVRDDPAASSFELEVRRLHADGSYRWFLSRGTVTRDPATGRPLRMTGTLTDITGRKRAEDALRASEEHFRTLLEQSPVATFVFSPDGQCLRCNPAAAAMYGVDPVTVTDYNVFADPRLENNDIGHAYRRALAGTPSAIPEIAHTVGRGTRKGETLWIRGSVYPLRDPANGRIVGLVATNEDVTERKRAQDALAVSERRFRKLVEQSPLSTQFFSPDGTMRDANGAWESLFGVPAERLAGSYNVLHDPQLVDRGVMPLIRRGFDGDAVRFPPIPYVPAFGDHAGQDRWSTALVFPVKDDAGRIEEVVLIHHDMTEQKRAEDALRASEAQYRQTAESNRRLLLEIDHRLRNQLAGLVSLVSLMRDRAPSVDDFANAIDARLRAMTHVHHLLSESQWQDLDLRSLVSSLLRHCRALSPHPTPVHLAGPPVSIPASRALPLSLILTEFLTNSIKYGAHSTPAGQVSLTWTLSPTRTLTLRWREQYGPPVPPTPNPSLGTSLINSFATRELAGTCDLTYPPAGASHTLTFPLSTA